MKINNLIELFSNSNLTEEEKTNLVFGLICAIREGYTLARKSQQPVPYRTAFGILYDLDPKLHELITEKYLTKTNESELVRYYRQKASATNNIDPKKSITPIDLVIADIDENKKLLGYSKEVSQIQKKVLQLEGVLDALSPHDYHESSMIIHDFNQKTRHPHFKKEYYVNEKIKDYHIGKNRVLRVRLAHPDNMEKVFGSDLVYENYDLLNKRVRFVHLQYKKWDTKKLYFYKRESDQLSDLETHFCSTGLCNGYPNSDSQDYRFPYCSAFLRPTSEITRPDSELKTTADHIPVCQVRKILEKTSTIIDKENIQNKSIKTETFEYLFNENLIGSRYISIDELELVYEKTGIKSCLNNIRIHMEEMKHYTEEEDRLKST